MKVSESFLVPEPREAVWQVVGEVERLMRCLPGLESVTVVDEESASVRLTQSLGPFKTTFDAKVSVTGREPGHSISFTATGRSVRGAAGNVRVTNAVRLEDEATGSTRVLLEAEVALGGMLGTVGQKAVTRQAAIAAKAFAEALEREVRSDAHAEREVPSEAAGDALRGVPAPERSALPPGRTFSDEFLELRRQALEWIGPYYGEHLARAADWLLALEPAAPEPLVLGALLHDIERAVPGGPILDKASQPWDDEGYNRAHCERSATVVAGWLVGKGASKAFVAGALTIREHEFGGSPEGDLLQAADSLSFLEVNGPLVAQWVHEGACSLEKGREKLRWMCERVRLERARPIARAQLAAALAELDRRVGVASLVRVVSPPTRPRGSSRFVEAGGLRLHFLEYGTPGRDSLVILPGITSPAVTWEFVALALAGDRHVVTMDLRGRGLSDTGPSYGLADLARDVAESLPALGLERPAVLGHSAGARVAAAFGVLYPDLRGPVIVADPPLSGPGRPPYPTPAESFLESIRISRAGATADDMRPYFPTWTEEQLALRAAWLPTCDEAAVAKVHRLFHVEDFFEWWPRLEPPALFLCGGASPAIGAAAAAEVAAANPAAEVVALPDAGHMLPWDDLDGFLAAVRGFLDRAGAR